MGTFFENVAKKTTFFYQHPPSKLVYVIAEALSKKFKSRSAKNEFLQKIQGVGSRNFSRRGADFQYRGSNP